VSDLRFWPEKTRNEAARTSDISTVEQVEISVATVRPAGRHLLVVSAETGAWFTHPWPEDRPIIVGRGELVDLRIDERAVSRVHARLEALGRDRFRVVDVGSANGTAVGGELRRGFAAEVRPGEPIVLGRTTIVIQVPARQEPGLDVPERLVSPSRSRSPAMLKIAGLVDRVAPTLLNVLLLGETGAGKDGLAELIHRRSTRGQREFMRLNCASFAEGVLESELFGHVKGAFTGATRDRPGLLEVASGGTVFLDEIGEMPLELQAKLLLVLEDRTVRRVGAVRSVPVDTRFISATNRDLREEVRRGRFREDLFYRLNGLSICVPPLRERMEDLPALVEHFVTLACAGLGRTRRPAVTAEALAELRRHHWPGNLRELRNAVERAVLLADGETLGAGDFHLESDEDTPAGASAATDPGGQIETGSPGGGERARILAALAATGGNQKRAAALLGVSRGTLLKRIDRYSIPRPHSPRGSRESTESTPIHSP